MKGNKIDGVKFGYGDNSKRPPKTIDWSLRADIEPIINSQGC